MEWGKYKLIPQHYLALPLNQTPPHMSRSRLALLFLSAIFTFCATSCKNDSAANDAATAKYPSPEEVYGDLFVAVQTASVFPDGKTFADCTPKVPVKEILAAYEAKKIRKNLTCALLSSSISTRRTNLQAVLSATPRARRRTTSMRSGTCSRATQTALRRVR